mmetsp:Transcript_17506/g.26780  ORF Transcript_17506/g.26780 Transcript_17506/m.26780 type:complete len:272 (+) Transcript_17506:50-865(+)
MNFQEIIQDAAWTMENLLSQQECQKIIQDASTTGMKQANGDIRHRNNFNHKFQDKILSEILWSRLSDLVPSKYIIRDPENHPAGFIPYSPQNMLGTWHPYAINTHFSVLYYKDGGHFGPHRDNHIKLSEHEQSMLTVGIYLNDRPDGSGGATHFLCNDTDAPAVDDATNRIQAPESSILVKVSADRAGKAVLFHHGLLHEGGVILGEKNPKWLLLTQVLYRRDESTAPLLSQDQKLARELLEQAEQAEVQSEFGLAMRLYKQAYRLDPSLE